MKKKETIDDCLLKERGALNWSACKGEECEKCGWNPDVDDMRRWFVKEYGLTKCEDGLKRLIM